MSSYELNQSEGNERWAAIGRPCALKDVGPQAFAAWTVRGKARPNSPAAPRAVEVIAMGVGSGEVVLYDPRALLAALKTAKMASEPAVGSPHKRLRGQLSVTETRSANGALPSSAAIRSAVLHRIALHTSGVSQLGFHEKLGVLVSAGHDRMLKCVRVAFSSDAEEHGSAHIADDEDLDLKIDVTLSIDVARPDLGLRGIASFALASLDDDAVAGGGSMRHDALQLAAVCGVLDRNVHIFNLETSEHVGVLPGHRAVVHALAMHSRSRSLVSLDTSGEMRVWDLTSLQLVQCISYNEAGERVTALCMHVDHGKLLTASRRVLLWRNMRGVASADERAVRALCPTGHHHPLVAACYASSFYIFITADEAGLICVWDVKTGAAVCRFEHSVSRLTTMACDDSGRRLLTGSVDGVMRLWNYSSGQMLYEMSTRRAPHTTDAAADAATAVPKSPLPVSPTKANAAALFRAVDANMLARTAAPAAGEDPPTPKHISRHKVELSACVHAKCGPVDSFVAAGWSRDVAVFENAGYHKPTPEVVGKGKGGLRAMSGHDEDVQAMCFCPPNLLCTGSAGGEIIAWNLTSCRLHKRMRVPARPATFPPSSRAPIPGRVGGNRDEEPFELSSPIGALCDSSSTAVDTLAYIEGGGGYAQLSCTLLSGTSDGYLRLWNPSRGTLLLQVDAIRVPLPPPPPPEQCGVAVRNTARTVPESVSGVVTSVCVESSATLLASADSLGRVRLWDVDVLAQCVEMELTANKERRASAVHKTGGISGRESDDEGSTHAGSMFVQLALDLSAPLEEASLIGWQAHTAEVVCVVYMMAIEGLATASRDRTVRMWSLGGEQVGIFGQANVDAWALEERSTWQEAGERAIEQDAADAAAAAAVAAAEEKTKREAARRRAMIKAAASFTVREAGLFHGQKKETAQGDLLSAMLSRDAASKKPEQSREDGKATSDLVSASVPIRMPEDTGGQSVEEREIKANAEASRAALNAAKARGTTKDLIDKHLIEMDTRLLKDSRPPRPESACVLPPGTRSRHLLLVPQSYARPASAPGIVRSTSLVHSKSVGSGIEATSGVWPRRTNGPLLPATKRDKNAKPRFILVEPAASRAATETAVHGALGSAAASRPPSMAPAEEEPPSRAFVVPSVQKLEPDSAATERAFARTHTSPLLPSANRMERTLSASGLLLQAPAPATSEATLIRAGASAINLNRTSTSLERLGLTGQRKVFASSERKDQSWRAPPVVPMEYPPSTPPKSFVKIVTIPAEQVEEYKKTRSTAFLGMGKTAESE